MYLEYALSIYEVIVAKLMEATVENVFNGIYGFAEGTAVVSSP